MLMCNLCELRFTSLYNKQSHYSGKLHLQTLLQHLNRVVKEADEDQYPNGSGSACDGQQSRSVPISKSLADMAKNWDSELRMNVLMCRFRIPRLYIPPSIDCAENISSLRANVKMKLEQNATLQQTLREAEVTAT